MPRLDLSELSGIFVGGGPFNASDPPERKSPVQHRVEAEFSALLDEVVARDFPFLGACYGVGTLGVHLGAPIDRTYAEPISVVPVTLTEAGHPTRSSPSCRRRSTPSSGTRRPSARCPTRRPCSRRRRPVRCRCSGWGANVYATQFHPELDVDGIIAAHPRLREPRLLRGRRARADARRGAARRGVVPEPDAPDLRRASRPVARHPRRRATSDAGLDRDRFAESRPSRSAEQRASFRRLTRARVGGWIVQLGRSHHTPRGAIARMCGIVGIVSTEPVNQQVYDSLLLLQHRGQDSTGIATADGRVFHMHEGARARCARRSARATCARLLGNMGLGHVRYATKGAAEREQEAQPFYVNAPYGIVLVHNGNLTNTRELTERAVPHRPPAPQHHERHRDAAQRARHTSCRGRSRGTRPRPRPGVRAPSSSVHERVEGSYAVDRADRRARPARVPRPVRHPPARSSASA